MYSTPSCSKIKTMLKNTQCHFLFKDLKGDTLNKTVIDALDRFICHCHPTR